MNFYNVFCKFLSFRFALGLWGLLGLLSLSGCATVSLDTPPPTPSSTAITATSDTASNTSPQGVGVGTRQGDAALLPNNSQGDITAARQIASVTPSDTTPTQDLPQTIPKVIYFDFDSDLIKSEHTDDIEKQARYLKANPQLKVGLEGHTDDLGGREYNLALGQRRAEAVRQALYLMGVLDQQMEAVSFGKERPAATGHDEASYRLNRRVELQLR